MKRYLLDTNIASHIIKGDIPQVRLNLERVPMHSIAVSAVTAGELLYGVAKRGQHRGLTTRVREFLTRVSILPWTSEVAAVYGRLRATCEATGVPLASLDMMITAHASALQEIAEHSGDQSVLVTRDQAFYRIPGREGLVIMDWTLPMKEASDF